MKHRSGILEDEASSLFVFAVPALDVDGGQRDLVQEGNTDSGSQGEEAQQVGMQILLMRIRICVIFFP